jgi:putative transposase
MTTITMPSSLALMPSLETAWQDVHSSFQRFCLTAGIGAIEQMLCEDAQQLAGARNSRDGDRVGYRWGKTKGKIGFHGGAAHRPRVRSLDGHEAALRPGRRRRPRTGLGASHEPERKLRRAVRLPAGDLPVIAGDGTSKSAASRRFVTLSAERLAEWMASDLSKLDFLRRNAAMALRWTAAGIYKHLPVLRAALAAHQSKYVAQPVEGNADAA